MVLNGDQGLGPEERQSFPAPPAWMAALWPRLSGLYSSGVQLHGRGTSACSFVETLLSTPKCQLRIKGFQCVHGSNVCGGGRW